MTGQDEREVAARVWHGLTDAAWESASPAVQESLIKATRVDSLIAAGFHLAPTAEVKAEALEEVVRQAMEQRAGGLVPLDGRTWGEPDGYWITMHAPIVAEAIAAHLRENGGA